jgi:hypothetical protein
MEVGLVKVQSLSLPKLAGNMGQWRKVLVVGSWLASLLVFDHSFRHILLIQMHVYGLQAYFVH